jgi:hypothetical protein
MPALDCTNITLAWKQPMDSSLLQHAAEVEASPDSRSYLQGLQPFCIDTEVLQCAAVGNQVGAECICCQGGAAPAAAAAELTNREGCCLTTCRGRAYQTVNSFGPCC